jgi:hypothetical protein
MQTKFQKRFILVFLLLISIAGAMAADISGKWAATIDTMIGQMNWSFTFKLDETKLSGMATYNGKEVALENGKVEGDAISFVENRDMEGLGPTRIEYTGKIVSADEIQFHRKLGEIAEEDFVAKRSK